LTRVYDVISGFVEDQTTGQIVNLSYTYTPQPAGTGQTPPNIGTYSIYSFGGTQTLTSLKISSGTAKGADVACIGDSKTVPIGSTNYAGGWCNLLQSGGYRALTLAGSGDLTASIVAEVPEIIALAPKNAVLMIGGNDVRSSVSSGTYEANISSIVSSLTAAGINVYVSTYPVENSGVNMTTLNTFIASTFPTSFIDINNSFPQTGSGVPATWLFTDSVHPAQPFHTYIAQSVLTRLQHDAIGQQFPSYHSTSGAQTIAHGTVALATSAIASGACQTVSAGSVNSASAPGVASTDVITWNPNVSLQTVSGYTVSTSGALSLDDYPTAGFVNWNVCNWTTGSVTPGAVTLNWSVVR
jgi:lysophospholipase L1-like esterase